MANTVKDAEVIDINPDPDDVTLQFTLPRGERGEKGTSVEITGMNVETLNPGEYATGSLSEVYNKKDNKYEYTLNFKIPRGATGGVSGGTLEVDKGGTGKATHISNAILTGNGINALNNISTTNGAFYATTANGAAQFGTLPVAQGGTGLTTTPSMTIDLGSTSAADIFAATPQPGVTGTLGLVNGGTGASTAAGARDNLDVYSKTEIDNAMDNLENSINQKIINEVDESIVISNTEPTSDKTKI